MPRIHINPVMDNLDESLKIAEKYGAAFEYQDFAMPALLENQNELVRRIHIYRGQERDVSEDTLHGAFLDVAVYSSDPRIQSASEYRILQSLEIAMALGCRGVIFHTNYIPNFNDSSYRSNWVYKNTIFFRRINRNFPMLQIYMENMFDTTPDLLRQLGEEMKDSNNFGICFDVAHAHLGKTPLKQWVSALGPFIRHIHMNDNKGDCDAHLAIGQGNIPWADVTRYLRDENIEASVLVEVNSLIRQQESLTYMQENHIYPF